MRTHRRLRKDEVGGALTAKPLEPTRKAERKLLCAQ